MLKKAIFSTLALCGLLHGHAAYAQEIRANLFIAYVFADKFDFLRYLLRV